MTFSCNESTDKAEGSLPEKVSVIPIDDVSGETDVEVGDSPIIVTYSVPIDGENSCVIEPEKSALTLSDVISTDDGFEPKIVPQSEVTPAIIDE